MFWPASKPEIKDNYSYDSINLELREITAELIKQNNTTKEQTELLKRILEEQKSQVIFLGKMDSYLKYGIYPIESGRRYKAYK